MRKLIDEDLKILLNDDSALDHDYEVELYEAVYSGLNSPLKIEVTDLASDVVKAIEHKLEWQSFLKFYATAALVIVFSIAILVTGISAVDKNLIVKLLMLLNNSKMIYLFTLMFFLGIQVTDKLLSFKQLQSKKS